jgi:hypothetical protein
LAAHSGKKIIFDRTIWRKNMISSTFWEKHVWQHILGKKLFLRMCCESWFFPECAANHIIFQNVQSVMFCPQKIYNWQ